MAARMVMGKTEERKRGTGGRGKKKASGGGLGRGGPLAAWGHNWALPVANAAASGWARDRSRIASACSLCVQGLRCLCPRVPRPANRPLLHSTGLDHPRLVQTQMQLQVREVWIPAQVQTVDVSDTWTSIILCVARSGFALGGDWRRRTCDGRQVPHRYRTGRLAWTGTGPGTGSRQAQAQEQEQPRHSTGWLATVSSILSRTLRGPAFAGSPSWSELLPALDSRWRQGR